jgi:hypothetical protein
MFVFQISLFPFLLALYTHLQFSFLLAKPNPPAHTPPAHPLHSIYWLAVDSIPTDIIVKTVEEFSSSESKQTVSKNLKNLLRSTWIFKLTT